VTEPDTRGGLRIKSVSHRYGSGKDQVTALGPVDITVEPGSFLVLVGASGCGKSTLLRLIAGFETPSEGTVAVEGTPPTPGVTAGVVFQQPRLFPWRTVGGNVELALKYAKVPRERRAERRDQVFELGVREILGEVSNMQFHSILLLLRSRIAQNDRVRDHIRIRGKLRR